MLLLLLDGPQVPVQGEDVGIRPLARADVLHPGRGGALGARVPHPHARALLRPRLQLRHRNLQRLHEALLQVGHLNTADMKYTNC